MDATRPWVVAEGVSGLYLVPWRSGESYSWLDLLLDSLGPTEIDFSAVVGFAVMIESSISFVVDDYGNAAFIISPGIGGGFGSSLGIGTTVYRGEINVNDLAGASVKVGGSIICVGIEGDDKGASSGSVWLPRVGADFHATVNYTFVIILREVKTSEN